MSLEGYLKNKARRPPKIDSAVVADTPEHVRDAIRAMHEQIPARLKILRGERAQRLYALRLGVYQQNVNRYENGVVPHPDFLVHLILLDNVNVEWLLMGTGDPYRKGGKPHEPTQEEKYLHRFAHLPGVLDGNTGRKKRPKRVKIAKYLDTGKPTPMPSNGKIASPPEDTAAIDLDKYLPKSPRR